MHDESKLHMKCTVDAWSQNTKIVTSITSAIEEIEKPASAYEHSKCIDKGVANTYRQPHSPWNTVGWWWWCLRAGGVCVCEGEGHWIQLLCTEATKYFISDQSEPFFMACLFSFTRFRRKKNALLCAPGAQRLSSRRHGFAVTTLSTFG